MDFNMTIWYNIFVMFMKEIIEKLSKLNKTVSTMESCTGGSLAGAITNIEGASEVFKYGAVTYSNEFKIKMGVSKEVIDEYSVYSMNTADEMSKNISKFSNSNYGIGITGKLNRQDINNMSGEDNIVYIRLMGACSNCAMLDYTLKDGIEEAIKSEIEEVKEVINVE